MSTSTIWQGDGRRLFINDVGPRDGLQSEDVFVPTEDKIALVNALSHAGVAKIEATSFTSPRAIPALADAEAVMAQIERVPGVTYAALVPNARGAERALSIGVDELNVVVSVSETHNLSNLRMTPEQSLAQFPTLLSMAQGQAQLNVSLATAFGCPFEGDIPQARVLDAVQRVVDMGINSVTLCDTTGMAEPGQVLRLCSAVRERWPDLIVTVHFHNTRGMGLTNILAALQAGVVRFDASLGGLGGCPFAPGASGNVCTEDVVHMLEAMGYVTGVDLNLLLEAAATLPALVGHAVPSQVLQAGPRTRRYDADAGLPCAAG